jgi:uncharacterized integral membrane protein (TIGR00698 family)
MLPGLGLCLALAVFARLLSAGMAEFGLVVSSALLVLLLGLALAAPLGAAAQFYPGRQFASGKLLKLGVALIGLRLDTQALLATGITPLLLAGAGLLSALLVAGLTAHLLGLNKRLSTLLATGTAICGVTAIMVTAPLIRARDEETAHAVACIVLIGMLATLIAPWGLQALLGEGRAIGQVMGAAIPDTAQVTGAALMHQQQYHATHTLADATLVKLLRNAALLLVVPMVAIAFNRNRQASGQGLPIPWFIVGFMVLVLVRALGDSLWPESQSWSIALQAAARLSEVCILMALAAIGLSLHPRALLTLGLRPALAAMAATGAATLSALWIIGAMA